MSERAYRLAEQVAGGCPIEAGLLLKLADNECEHGRLPGDKSTPCGCWPIRHEIVMKAPDLAVIIPLPDSRRRLLRARRARVARLYATDARLDDIAEQLGIPRTNVVSDVRYLRQQGIVGYRNPGWQAYHDRKSAA